jgi:O-antigen/teichoic acid export membrane protein
MPILATGKAGRLISLLRLEPFETSTPDGQARERHRRIALATIASGMAKGVSVLTGLIIVPMTLHYLGEERYAMWVMISSLFMTMTAADFGIGTGVLNLVAAASGKDDRVLIKKYVSSGFFMLLAMGVVLGGIMLACCAIFPMSSLFNVTSEIARREANWAVVVVALVLGLGLPVMVVLRFQEGLQEGFYTYLAQMGGNVLALGFALSAIKLELGLPWLVLSLLGGPFLANLGAFFLQFFISKRWACPAWSKFQGETTRGLLKTGGLFFLINMMTLIGMQAMDPFVISHVLGPVEGAKQVAAYSVVQKLSQIAFLYWALVQALWPAYAEAIARQDFTWVRKTILRSIRLSLVLGSCIGLFLALCGNWLIRFWVGRVLTPSECRPLLLSFAVFTGVFSVAGTISVVINGAHWLREQLLCLLVTTPVAFLLKIILCRLWGASGVVWASTLAYAVCFIAPLWVLIRRRFWVEPVVPISNV